MAVEGTLDTQEPMMEGPLEQPGDVAMECLPEPSQDFLQAELDKVGFEPFAIFVWQPSVGDAAWAVADQCHRIGLLGDIAFTEKVQTAGHAAIAIKDGSGRNVYISFWPDARRGRDDDGLWFGKWHTLSEDIQDEGRYPDDIIRLETDANVLYFGQVLHAVHIQSGLSRLEYLKANTPGYHAKGQRGGFSCSSLVKDILENMLEVNCMKTSFAKALTDDRIGLNWKELGVGLLAALPAVDQADINRITQEELEFQKEMIPTRMKKLFKESKAVTPNFFRDAFTPLTPGTGGL